VLHVVRDGSMRRLSSIAAVIRRPGGPVVVPALDWCGGDEEPVAGPGWAALAARLGLPTSGGCHDVD
jgi:pilus assembly protein CpaF